MANENRSINLHWRRASADGGLRPCSTSLYQTNPEEKQLKPMWDCGSSLYDSFELYTFSQQLKSAIAGGSSSSSFIMEDDHRNPGKFRSLSMPHYVSRGRISTSELVKAVIEEEQQHMERFTHNSQSDLLPLPRTRSKLGIPLLVKRLLNRAFHRRRNNCKTTEREAW